MTKKEEIKNESENSEIIDKFDTIESQPQAEVKEVCKL